MYHSPGLLEILARTRKTMEEYDCLLPVLSNLPCLDYAFVNKLVMLGVLLANETKVEP